MSRAGVWVGGGLALLAVVAFLTLSSRQPEALPFDVGSSAPDGYAAVARLVREQGVEVNSSTAERAAGLEGWGGSDVLFVPVPSYATTEQHAAFAGAARAGATLVYGEPHADGSEGVDQVAPDEPPTGIYLVDARTLADTPATPVDSDLCDMPDLVGLSEIDAAFAGPAAVTADNQSCFGDADLAYFQRSDLGDGSLVTLGSPYLWVNARLQPSKESNGPPLDNAATALRILSPGASELGADAPVARVTVIQARPSAGATTNGTQDPLQLLPVPVKLALVQLIAAFGIFIWWRSRRLGRPVPERMPVEIAGSELVVAVGDLLRRKGNPTRAAAELRAEARAQLGSRLGVPSSAPVQMLCALVAGRTGRDEATVRAALVDAHVADSESLVQLARTLDSIRTEVLDVPVPR